MTQRGRGGARPANRSGGGRGSQDAEQTRQPAAPRIDLVAARARVRAVIEPVVVAAGFDLEDVSLSRAGRRHLVRVLVDADGGISLDDVAVVSREISQALDTADETQGEVLAGEYQLEVGSPGVDRPLTLPRHWRRNTGRLVAVTTGDGVARTGRVVEAGEDRVALDVDGERLELSLAEVARARVEVEFTRKGGTSQPADDLSEDADAGDEEED